MSEFRFKQFAVRQDETPMKVGTDGVLLGAWVNLCATDRRILDIGTGTGVIALMLAQRTTEVVITGLDVASVEEARFNAARTAWCDRLRFEQCAVQQFESEPFDLVVSNPPFFTESLLCPDAGRTTARHTVTLPFEELRDAVLRLMSATGRFAVVLPVTEYDRFEQICAGLLVATRRTEVRTTPRHAAKRVLVEMQRPEAVTTPCQTDELLIGTGLHEEYTDAYRRLTGDFYLKF